MSNFLVLFAFLHYLLSIQNDVAIDNRLTSIKTIALPLQTAFIISESQMAFMASQKASFITNRQSSNNLYCSKPLQARYYEVQSLNGIDVVSPEGRGYRGTIDVKIVRFRWGLCKYKPLSGVR